MSVKHAGVVAGAVVLALSALLFPGFLGERAVEARDTTSQPASDESGHYVGALHEHSGYSDG